MKDIPEPDGTLVTNIERNIIVFWNLTKRKKGMALAVLLIIPVYFFKAEIFELIKPSDSIPVNDISSAVYETSKVKSVNAQLEDLKIAIRFPSGSIEVAEKIKQIILKDGAHVRMETWFDPKLYGNIYYNSKYYKQATYLKSLLKNEGYTKFTFHPASSWEEQDEFAVYIASITN